MSPKQLAGFMRSADSAPEHADFKPPRGLTFVDPDPLLWSRDVQERYNWSSRTKYRNEAILPEPSIIVNGRKAWRKSALDCWDTERRGVRLSQIRASINELREFILAHSELSRAEVAELDALISTATRVPASEIAA